MASSYGLIVYKINVKATFLIGELEEEIYMNQPDGFVVKYEEKKVCKLLKYISNQKRAHMQWHEKFKGTLIYVGFSINEVYKCIFYLHGWGEGVILCF
jgi:hypothetical protein